VNYWIVTLPREDMEHCIKIGTFGLNAKQSMGSIEPADRIVCCVTKEKPWKAIAFGEITSNMYVDDKQIFKKPGGYWYRFDFKAESLDKEQEIDVQELMGDFSFVTNHLYWPVYFKGGVKKIAETDWNLLKTLAPNRLAKTCDT
jgi:ribosomal protein L14